jgi:uncharacterized membrane protein
MAPAIAVAAAAWPALLIAAPVLPLPAAGALYAVGSLICHQIPERSFYLQGFQLPVCARCLGLYAGAALGSVAALVVGRAFRGSRPRAATTYVVTAVAAVPTVITVAIEWGAGWPVSNVARAAAAVPLACAVAFVVVRAVATVHYDECTPRRPIGHGQPPANT